MGARPAADDAGRLRTRTMKKEDGLNRNRLFTVLGLATALTIGSSVIAGAAHAQAPATAPGQELPGTVRVARTQDSVTVDRSEEQKSELQSIMHISYAVVCLKQKKSETSCAKLIPEYN